MRSGRIRWEWEILEVVTSGEGSQRRVVTLQGAVGKSWIWRDSRWEAEVLLGLLQGGRAWGRPSPLLGPKRVGVTSPVLDTHDHQPVGHSTWMPYSYFRLSWTKTDLIAVSPKESSLFSSLVPSCDWWPYHLLSNLGQKSLSLWHISYSNNLLLFSPSPTSLSRTFSLGQWLQPTYSYPLDFNLALKILLEWFS